MPAALLNMLAGLAQPLVTSAVGYGLAKGWFDQSTLLAVVGGIGWLGGTLTSAVTTKVTTTNPPASPGK